MAARSGARGLLYADPVPKRPAQLLRLGRRRGKHVPGAENATAPGAGEERRGGPSTATWLPSEISEPAAPLHADGPKDSARWMAVAEEGAQTSARSSLREAPERSEPRPSQPTWGTDRGSGENRGGRDARSDWLPSVASEPPEDSDGASSKAQTPELPPGLERWLQTRRHDNRAAAPRASQVSTADDRQTRAVGAYCAEMCGGGLAATAAAETLGAFVGGDDRELLRLTRSLAAKHTAAESEWHPSAEGRGVGRLGGCGSAAALLASRANGELGSSERARLESHLSGCLGCQATELRMARAERAFSGVVGADLSHDAAASDAARTIDHEPSSADEPPAAHARLLAPALATAGAAGAAGAAAAAETAGSPEPLPRPRGERTGVRAASGAGEASRRRRPRLMLALAAAAVVLLAGAAVAAALVAGGTSKHQAPRAAIVTPRASTPTVAPAHRAGAKPKPAADKRRGAHRSPPTASAAARPASSGQTSPPATASPQVSAPTPSPSSSSSSPSTSPRPPTPQSNPAPSPSSGSSSPSTSIQQPSLGATSAPQGIGSTKH